MLLNRISTAFLASQPVLEHERRNAPIAEPFRERVALMPQTKLGVPAARTDHDRCTCRFLSLRDIGRERRIVNVANILAADFFRLSRTSLRARSPPLPQRNRCRHILRQIRKRCGGRQDNDQGNKKRSHGISCEINLVPRTKTRNAVSGGKHKKGQSGNKKNLRRTIRKHTDRTPDSAGALPELT